MDRIIAGLALALIAIALGAFGATALKVREHSQSISNLSNSITHLENSIAENGR